MRAPRQPGVPLRHRRLRCGLDVAGGAEAVGIEQYEHDPDDEHWGFSSWNDFFTRRFRDGERPVEDPDDDGVVVSPCESTPYALARDVQHTDEFWLKSQPYSLQDMLAGDPSVEEFVGGTVYQAYLSATDYHRWHAPVAGTVERAFVVGGTYFSEADSEGPEAREPQQSQGYMAHVAARAVVLLRATTPPWARRVRPRRHGGRLLVRPRRRRRPGAHLAKGDEVGRFQFGGSTFCLVFRPGAWRSSPSRRYRATRPPRRRSCRCAPASPARRERSDPEASGAGARHVVGVERCPAPARDVPVVAVRDLAGGPVTAAVADREDHHQRDEQHDATAKPMAKVMASSW